eukprot:COSAG02_NODE_17654_length_989_cov_0.824719_1_plen_27_part_01
MAATGSSSSRGLAGHLIVEICGVHEAE